MNITQQDDGKHGAFLAHSEGKQAGEMTYTWAGETMFIIDHTDVDEAFKGQGVGRRKAGHAFDQRQQRGAAARGMGHGLQRGHALGLGDDGAGQAPGHELRQRGQVIGEPGRALGVDAHQQARALCGVPLVASGGAGEPEHFAAVFEQADVDGALAASTSLAGLGNCLMARSRRSAADLSAQASTYTNACAGLEKKNRAPLPA